MMERAKETASRAKDAAANAAKHDPKLAGLLTAGGALLSETKKKFEESRGALMLSTFDKLEPKLAGPLGAEVAAQRMGKVIKVVVEFAARWWEGCMA